MLNRRLFLSIAAMSPFASCSPVLAASHPVDMSAVLPFLPTVDHIWSSVRNSYDGITVIEQLDSDKYPTIDPDDLIDHLNAHVPILVPKSGSVDDVTDAITKVLDGGLRSGRPQMNQYLIVPDGLILGFQTNHTTQATEYARWEAGAAYYRGNLIGFIDDNTQSTASSFYYRIETDPMAANFNNALLPFLRSGALRPLGVSQSHE